MTHSFNINTSGFFEGVRKVGEAVEEGAKALVSKFQGAQGYIIINDAASIQEDINEIAVENEQELDVDGRPAMPAPSPARNMGLIDLSQYSVSFDPKSGAFIFYEKYQQKLEWAVEVDDVPEPTVTFKAGKRNLQR